MRRVMAIIGLMACSAAGAAEPDILYHAMERKAEVEGRCPALLAQPTPKTSDAIYLKAVCLLYGVGVPPQVDVAVELLRLAAAAEVVAAQIALADTLQQGAYAHQTEALDWYGKAAAAGDVRARVRMARLGRQLSSADAITVDDQAALPPGYHCHIYSLTKKVCHAVADR
jgi:TPR repeat protein